MALAFFDNGQNPQYSFYHASKEAIPDYPEPQKDEIILLGSSFALRDKGRNELLDYLVKAQKAGCCIIYDPNARKHLAEDPEFMKKIEENISLATIVKGSDEDFRLIFNESNGKGAYEKVWKAGANFLFYTKGSQGSEFFSPEVHLEIKAPEIKVVSTIGAGDNFSAGIAYGLYINYLKNISFHDLKENDWRRIMELGTLFATRVCESSENYIPWETVEELGIAPQYSAENNQ